MLPAESCTSAKMFNPGKSLSISTGGISLLARSAVQFWAARPTARSTLCTVNNMGGFLSELLRY